MTAFLQRAVWCSIFAMAGCGGQSETGPSGSGGSTGMDGATDAPPADSGGQGGGAGAGGNGGGSGGGPGVGGDGGTSGSYAGGSGAAGANGYCWYLEDLKHVYGYPEFWKEESCMVTPELKCNPGYVCCPDFCRVGCENDPVQCGVGISCTKQANCIAGGEIEYVGP